MRSGKTVTTWAVGLFGWAKASTARAVVEARARADRKAEADQFARGRQGVLVAHLDRRQARERARAAKIAESASATPGIRPLKLQHSASRVPRGSPARAAPERRGSPIRCKPAKSPTSVPPVPTPPRPHRRARRESGRSSRARCRRGGPRRCPGWRTGAAGTRRVSLPSRSTSAIAPRMPSSRGVNFTSPP